jgi:hypothetical protein
MNKMQIMDVPSQKIEVLNDGLVIGRMVSTTNIIDLKIKFERVFRQEVLPREGIIPVVRHAT